MGRGSAFICAFLVVVALQLHADHSVAHELSHELRGKVFLVRNFYRGDRLQYDSAGQPLGSPPTGSWTVDGALGISKVNISHNRLQIHSKRYFLSPTPAGYELLPSERELTIEVNVGSQAITVESVHALMNHVFLPPQDRAADLVPAYWKPCFGAQTTAAPACRMSPHIAPLFRFASPLQAASAVVDATKVSADQSIVKIGNGVTPPRAIYAPDPEYSEEARRERVQGIVVIELVVDKSGRPRDIKLASPIGYGLDEKAMDTVKTWKFEPSRRGGEPVAVYANIEVAFRLCR